MVTTVTWRGFGWKRQTIGRVKLSGSAPFYRNRWVDLVEITETGARVFIHPTERDVKNSEISKIDLWRK